MEINLMLMNLSNCQFDLEYEFVEAVFSTNCVRECCVWVTKSPISQIQSAGGLKSPSFCGPIGANLGEP